jgi:hypothetical protein
MNASKYLIFVILLLLAILAGIYFGAKMKLFEHKQEVSTSIVLNQIQKVTKLITLETNVSELYTYKDFNTYDIGLLRKKAIVRVNAKASIGYDFNKIGISLNSDTKKVSIKNFPPAEILSIDHNLDYFDIEQGLFNSLTEADYNKINTEAKALIIKSLNQGVVMKEAEAQKKELVELLRLMLTGMGYNLEVSDVELKR